MHVCICISIKMYKYTCSKLVIYLWQLGSTGCDAPKVNFTCDDRIGSLKWTESPDHCMGDVKYCEASWTCHSGNHGFYHDGVGTWLLLVYMTYISNYVHRYI